ncbi:hypothetical protein ACTWKD_06315 [Halanaerobium saccharolyticum]|uniref:hypothetical protein n=1 Tax=Halanaerobium TaxID=2330 RepID=UPI000DE71DDE|nr:hypothetical protein [Halanaerobium sp.]PUU88157.1 MAG: curlin associated repeat-containing protein [Halanaerobium sp.]PUU91155.1 MAG: curlin associated repeat-containing protein [Halanaerobium sp.]
MKKILFLAFVMIMALSMSATAFGGMGIGGDVAVIDQLGSFNDAAITQDGYSWGGCGWDCPLCTDNIAVILQDGVGNKNYVTQKGSDNLTHALSFGFANTVIQEQNGHDLTAFAVQHGVFNHATQMQSGKMNVSMVRQIGVANKALTMQSGGNCFCGDTALITQMGFANNAEIYQY